MVFAFGYSICIWVWSLHLGVVFLFGYGLCIWVWLFHSDMLFHSSMLFLHLGSIFYSGMVISFGYALYI